MHMTLLVLPLQITDEYDNIFIDVLSTLILRSRTPSYETRHWDKTNTISLIRATAFPNNK